MKTHPDVLIVGGGVIGLTTAYFLAEEGAGVEVLEQDIPGRQASWAGAGIIAPGNPERARRPADQLRAHSVTLFPELSRRLREQTGIDNGYRVCGGLELDVDESLVPLWQEEGISFRRLEGGELRQLMPGLSPSWRRGFHLPGMAQVRNPRHLHALRAACTLQGARVKASCPVQRLVLERGRISAVESLQGRHSAGTVLLCAGPWTEALLRQVGAGADIRPVRGQIALLNTGKEGCRPIVMVGKRYLVPREDGRVLVGSTEEEASFAAQPTAGAISELLAFAAELMPELAGATLERCWAGLRPGSPDGLPFLGPVPGVENLWVAAGHFRAGIQLSAGTALVLRQRLLGQATSFPLEPFGLDRPAGPLEQTAFRS